MAKSGPKPKIDMEMVEKLASIHCTNTEIGAALGFDPSILSKPGYSEIVAKGKERGKLSLRRKMMETAMGGNVTMQIWLSKQYLGMSDKLEERIDHTTNGKDISPVAIKEPLVELPPKGFSPDSKN